MPNQNSILFLLILNNNNKTFKWYPALREGIKAPHQGSKLNETRDSSFRKLQKITTFASKWSSILKTPPIPTEGMRCMMIPTEGMRGMMIHLSTYYKSHFIKTQMVYTGHIIKKIKSEN